MDFFLSVVATLLPPSNVLTMKAICSMYYDFHPQTLSQVVASDAGQYSCSAFNNGKEIKSTVQIDISGMFVLYFLPYIETKIIYKVSKIIKSFTM